MACTSVREFCPIMNPRSKAGALCLPRKIVSTAVRIAQGSKERLRLGNVEIARDWGWAPEYVEAMWLLMQKSEPSDIVIATGQTQTLRQFAGGVFSELGLVLEDHLKINASLLRPSEVVRTRTGCQQGPRAAGLDGQKQNVRYRRPQTIAGGLRTGAGNWVRCPGPPATLIDQRPPTAKENAPSTELK